MDLNQIFELSVVLDGEQFRKVFDMAYNESGYFNEHDDKCIDTSLVEKGITVIYRDSQYKKKVRLLINTYLVVDDTSDTNKLIRTLDKRISEYFNHNYNLNDFTLSGVTFIADIDVGSKDKADAYMKVLQRVGKVKGFSPVSYEHFDEKTCFCLSGNSNGIDFLLYGLENAVGSKLKNSKTDLKRLGGVLRAEVRLTKPKAIRSYTTDTDDVSDQIVSLVKNSTNVFMDTFTQIIPFGEFCKKDRAVEIIRRDVKDSVMRRRMLKLLTLISEKKSLHLAQKAMNCRNVEKVMDAFAKINLSPVTISKRQAVKWLDTIYSYL